MITRDILNTKRRERKSEEVGLNKACGDLTEERERERENLKRFNNGGGGERQRILSLRIFTFSLRPCNG